VIRCNGEIVAPIDPAEGATGALVKELLAGAPGDRGWADVLRDLRSSLSAVVSDWRE
jgi:hypothetical protein